MVLTYDKLVRDKIPDILRAKEKEFSYRVANDGEYWDKLCEKLQEEVTEFLEKPSIEELADIQQVLMAIQDRMGFCHMDLEIIRTEKAIQRGEFERGYILESVVEE